MPASALARLSDATAPGLSPVTPLPLAGQGTAARVGALHGDAANASAAAAQSVPLTSLGRHATGTVAGVRVPTRADGSSDPAVERIALRLIEIGFVEGEHLQVVAFGQPGQDPIGVRVGGRGGATTFALRRQEAACIQVWPTGTSSSAAPRA